MSSLGRRRFLAASAAAFGAGLAYGHWELDEVLAAPPWQERRDLYPQGVASGDPAADSVILWTRRPPVADSRAQRLTVEVASDQQFARIVARGAMEIGAEADWTCRFLAAGLKPGREYWYRFTDEHGFGSRVGRTLTAPADSDGRAVRFAFVSCQMLTEGANNAYRRMIYEDERRAPAERLGFVLHLGDFIYEVVWYPEDKKTRYSRTLRDLIRFPQGEKIGDLHVPVTLDDYRTLYRVYLQDPDLQDARARFPFVCVWDNHEFSWQGYQSQQVFGGETRPAQTKKIAANQTWFEYQPARVVKHGGDTSLDRFVAPAVKDAKLETFDDQGLGLEPNNLDAVQSLKITRALRYGRHVDLILTDNRSFMSAPPDTSAFSAKGFRYGTPRDAEEILDSGRAYAGGTPPSTIRYGGRDVPNPSAHAAPQSCLGGAQKAWLIDRLKQSRATWKIWGHSFGTLESRCDFQNLPDLEGRPRWPGSTYALFNGGFFEEKRDILDVIRDRGITGFAVVAGDRHSFWAGTLSKHLPPEKFEPLGIEFITGSISASGMFEAAEYSIPKDDPWRALYLHDRADGSVAPAINMATLHGVQSVLTLQKTGDVKQALAQSNADVAPHLSFVEMGGHGYTTVRVTATEMETEFVCIPRPLTRSDREDGGPLAYRIVHTTQLWKAGEPPRLVARVVEGKPSLSMKSPAI
jgi:alkaline phosphatase D